MTKKLVSSVAAGALLVGVTFAPTSFAQQTTTPPPADPAAPTQMQPGGTTPPATEPPADQAQTPPPAGEKPADTAAAKSDYLTEQADDQIATSTYVGQAVYNAADESIGEINDLIIKKDGGVEAAVIGVGGFLGIGEKNVAVPFDRIEISEQADTAALKLTTTETADTLKAAPEFKTKAQMMAERQAAQPVDQSTTSSTGTTPATPTQPAPQQ
ncbi:PRC-barrel domain-containing protein [Sinorhizobium garamanticum]|uniref:PRC-barrel domain-containing protein n=1 Tax=Sinorhizobium garamanticum TaxID=680247 RepID=A0ABY8DEH6_9HYPH|nr:PRC-barrel domain-containing protein [Sinorhizobium garamanticum]WEX87940.1 PRC-barrel domain-containing protein [Sinorhizobium garamanticum]